MTNLDSGVRSLLYLGCAVAFVLGLHLMNSPRTARRGNAISAAGMACAVAIAFVGSALDGFEQSAAVVVLIAALATGSFVGLWTGKRVQMTSMPQLVSAFNMVGGGAAALIAIGEALRAGPSTEVGTAVTTAAGLLIGSVTVTGSLIAAGKLQGFVSGNPIRLPAHRLWESAAVLIALTAVVWSIAVPDGVVSLAVLLVSALAVGILVVLPIGGADMPVVISLLNACTGIAVAMAGFALSSPIMIIAGALVGSAGTILSILMGAAMNRSIISIVVGGFGTAAAGVVDVAGGTGAAVRETTADDVAIQLAYAHKVIIVPGYGLAAARAQRECADLGALLVERGIDVSYAIHPVAGRMPGQMNVLLAEANVPYDLLDDMDASNPGFALADVALVVGANAVTNPAARRPGNAISGMPILDVDKAKSVVVLKRSMGHGYAGIDNELYLEPQTTMLFGDAEQSLVHLLSAIKTLVA